MELEWKRWKIEWLRGYLCSSSSLGSGTWSTIMEFGDLSLEGERMWVGWLDGETTVEGVCGEGVGDAEEREESSEVDQGYVSMSTSSDDAGGATRTRIGFGFDGKAKT